MWIEGREDLDKGREGKVRVGYVVDETDPLLRRGLKGDLKDGRVDTVTSASRTFQTKTHRSCTPRSWYSKYPVVNIWGFGVVATFFIWVEETRGSNPRIPLVETLFCYHSGVIGDEPALNLRSTHTSTTKDCHITQSSPYLTCNKLCAALLMSSLSLRINSCDAV